MRASDIPDYKSKRIRVRTWVPRGYAEYRDGVWWHNTMLPGGRYELAPGKDVDAFDPYHEWEEYIEWKAEVRERLHELRLAVDRRHARTKNELWALDRTVDKL